jgi:anti-sigma factor RsiW
MTTPVRDLPCQEIVELVTDYVEGTMDPELRAAFDAHLGVCPHCVAYVEQIEATIRIAGSIQVEELPAGFRAGLLEAFRDFHRG